MEINQFEQLIRPVLKSDSIYLAHRCKALLPVGENYGSTMLDVEIQLKEAGKNNDEKTIHCIAKTCPPKGCIWSLFNIPTSFEKEIGFYTEIVPELYQFCMEHEVILDCFAKCIGARISSDRNAVEVDEDAVLLLENLKFEGYNTLNRFIGFDYSCTEAIIKYLAVYHAASIAYKSKYPEEFNKIMPLLSKTITLVFPEETFDYIYDHLKEFIDDNHHALLSRVRDSFSKIFNFREPQSNTNRLFQTITHNDMWLNNIMIKQSDQNIKIKFVDFQTAECSSLASDLLFFLYTSVQVSVLQDYFYHFLQLYYDIFIETLIKLNCKVGAYTLDAFLKEIDYVASNYEFCRILCLLAPIYTLKGKAKDLAEFSMDDCAPVAENLHENYKKKVNFIIEDFARRKWI